LRALFWFIPRLTFPRTWDRGWALEQAWRRSLGFDVKSDVPTLNDWQKGVMAGWRPAVAFNTTIVETGGRAVLATYSDLPTRSMTGAKDIGDDDGIRRCDQKDIKYAPAWDGKADAKAVTHGCDLSVVTAARLSAGFPYVTPVPRRSDACCRGMIHLADGGYWDDAGIVTVLDWLRAAREELKDRPVLVIQIAPARIDNPAIHDRAWVWQLTAPLSALTSVRSEAQRARNDIEIAELQAHWPSNRISFVTITDQGANPTLGWHLSREERCEIEKRWWDGYVESGASELQTIGKVLGPRAAGYKGPTRDCAP
jgi:hypothetical protein